MMSPDYPGNERTSFDTCVLELASVVSSIFLLVCCRAAHVWKADTVSRETLLV